MICVPSAWTMKVDREADRARVLRVRAADGGARLCITLELSDAEGAWHETLTVFASRLSRAPQIGEIEKEELSQLRREAALCEALAMGLRSLGAGGGSEEHLARKLRARGVAPQTAKEATRELAQRGYLDEEAAAVREVERALSKLRGNRRILAELRTKGYGEDAMNAARERLSGEDSVARCRRLLQKKRRTVRENEENADKLIASLMRYGYTVSEIRAALRAELEDE